MGIELLLEVVSCRTGESECLVCLMHYLISILVQFGGLFNVEITMKLMSGKGEALTDHAGGLKMLTQGLR